MVLGSGGTWAAVSGLPSRTEHAAAAWINSVPASLGLVVTSVTVTGRRNTASEDVLAAIAVDRGDLISDFDPAAALRRLEALSWVRTAAVSRRLPGRVHVDLTERRPAALWQYRGAVRVIDRRGIVLTADRVRRFDDLPLVVGADADSATDGLLALLGEHPELAERVAAAVRVGGRRWDLHFDVGLVLRLPAGDPAAAWGRFAVLDRERGVLLRQVEAVDLRLAGRMFLLLTPSDAEAFGALGRDA